VGLVLVEDGQSRVFHQLTVQFLEFLQGVLVVLTGTLCQDIHPEIRVGYVFLVRLLVGRRELVSLALKFLLLQVDYDKSQLVSNTKIEIEIYIWRAVTEITAFTARPNLNSNLSSSSSLLQKCFYLRWILTYAFSNAFYSASRRRWMIVARVRRRSLSERSASFLT